MSDIINTARKAKDKLEDSEWRFSNFHNGFPFEYEEFHLKSVTLQDYEDWLNAWIKNQPISTFVINPIKHNVGSGERKYEVAYWHSDLWGPHIHMRIKAVQAGANLIVYSRGGHWIGNEDGQQIRILFYLTYEHFYLEMIKTWSLEPSKTYLEEKEKYPPGHSVWSGPVWTGSGLKLQFTPRRTLGYPENGKSSTPKEENSGRQNLRKIARAKNRTQKFEEYERKYPGFSPEAIANKIGVTYRTIQRDYDDLQKDMTNNDK